MDDLTKYMIVSGLSIITETMKLMVTPTDFLKIKNSSPNSWDYAETNCYLILFLLLISSSK